MNNFPDAIFPVRARVLTALAAIVAALLIAGCGGSSSGSSTITIGNENTADNSLIKAGESKTAETKTTSTGTGTTSSTKTAKNESAAHPLKEGEAPEGGGTPKTGPLSERPKVPHGYGNEPPTRLVKVEVIKGKGAEAKVGSTVEVNYVGGIWKTGKEFDASWNRNEPFTFTIGKGEVIKGWEEGVVGMKAGGRRILVIPAELAYGSKATSGIPANSELTFVIDLLKA